MSIGNNIRKWRDYRGLRQSELANILGISDKTISSWETNRTEPKMGMVEKICIALDCRKTDIIGAELKSSEQPAAKNVFECTVKEQRIIEKYRSIDNYGKDMVCTILNKEYERCTEHTSIASVGNRSYLMPEAAHERTDIKVTEEMIKHDDDIMDDDDFWK